MKKVIGRARRVGGNFASGARSTVSDSWSQASKVARRGGAAVTRGVRGNKAAAAGAASALVAGLVALGVRMRRRA